MMTSPTFRYREVSPNSTRQGDSVAWRGAGYGELISTSQWEGPRSTISPITASPRRGRYRPLRGITLTRPSCSSRMPSCAAKSRPPSLYVPGPGFSPGPPTASPGMTIGRSDPLPCIGFSLSRSASKQRRLLEASGFKGRAKANRVPLAGSDGRLRRFKYTVLVRAEGFDGEVQRTVHGQRCRCRRCLLYDALRFQTPLQRSPGLRRGSARGPSVAAKRPDQFGGTTDCRRPPAVSRRGGSESARGRRPPRRGRSAPRGRLAVSPHDPNTTRRFPHRASTPPP